MVADEAATGYDPDAVRGDYLIWPPVISLLRIDLEQQGLLN